MPRRDFVDFGWIRNHLNQGDLILPSNDEVNRIAREMSRSIDEEISRQIFAINPARENCEITTYSQDNSSLTTEESMREMLDQLYEIDRQDRPEEAYRSMWVGQWQPSTIRNPTIHVVNNGMISGLGEGPGMGDRIVDLIDCKHDLKEFELKCLSYEMGLDARGL